MFFQFFKFILVGLTNTGFTYLIYLGLLYIINYKMAYTVAYILGIIISYLLNLKFVFKAKSSKKKIAIFPFIYGIQYSLGMLILYITVDKFNLPKKIAPLLVILITTPITFLLSKFVLSNKSKINN